MDGILIDTRGGWVMDEQLTGTIDVLHVKSFV
jgi:hypothetical protein